MGAYSRSRVLFPSFRTFLLGCKYTITRTTIFIWKSEIYIAGHDSLCLFHTFSTAFDSINFKFSDRDFSLIFCSRSNRYSP